MADKKPLQKKYLSTIYFFIVLFFKKNYKQFFKLKKIFIQILVRTQRACERFKHLFQAQFEDGICYHLDAGTQ